MVGSVGGAGTTIRALWNHDGWRGRRFMCWTNYHPWLRWAVEIGVGDGGA
jgi:hypothetical protein